MEIMKNTVSGTITDKPGKLRVAAYVRVSSDEDTADGSYEMQESYFSSLITSSPDMELINIYGDHGISGRHTWKREGFKSMMADSKNRAFDRILCKSVSRFARNMRDCVENINILKSRGISVYFEREGLDTADPKNSLILSILATIAQEESESTKENIDMARKRRMAEGKPWENPPYGYRYDKKTAEWRIEEHEALMVRELFKSALKGMNYKEISVHMSTLDPDGKWTQYNIRDRLINEKYTGDYITGKSYMMPTKDGMVHKMNKGEREQFFIEGHHQGIISHEVSELAQEMVKKRLLCSGRKAAKGADELLLAKAMAKAINIDGVE